MEKKKEILVIVGSLLIIILSVTLAYFTVQIIGKGKEISLDSANLRIVFTSGTGTIAGAEIEPGWSSGVNTFTVKNESNDTYKYNIVIKDLVNTFVTKGFLQYKITSSDGGYNMSDFVDVPKSSQATDTILAYSVEIAKGVTHTYNVEFKYLTSEEDQSDDMGKELSGTLFIEEGTEKPLTLAEKLIKQNPTISARTDFSTTYTETNTGTLFKSTESIAGSAAKDVYYFAGDAKNNWVKFGTYKINGPIRGYSSSTSTSYREYVSMEECTSASSYNYNCSYAWSPGDDIYWRIIRTNADGSVRILYSGTSPDTTSGYISVGSFNHSYWDPMYVGYMYGTSGTLASNRTNKNDSKIKEVIDAWYSSYLNSYTKYISATAVYCSDRNEQTDGAYNTGSTAFYYTSYYRATTSYLPSYNCTNSKDAFSGSNSEAKLTYPIALATIDELMYAGGKYGTNLSSPYAWYYTNSTGGSITGNQSWWLLSPYGWYNELSRMWLSGDSDYPGYLGTHTFASAVRPVTSIKSDVLWSSGDGSPENPYEIVYD